MYLSVRKKNIREIFRSKILNRKKQSSVGSRKNIFRQVFFEFVHGWTGKIWRTMTRQNKFELQLQMFFFQKYILFKCQTKKLSSMIKSKVCFAGLVIKFRILQKMTRIELPCAKNWPNHLGDKHAPCYHFLSQGYAYYSYKINTVVYLFNPPFIFWGHWHWEQILKWPGLLKKFEGSRNWTRDF